MDYPPPDFIERISVMMEREKMCSLTSHDLFSETGLKPDMREIISRWYLEVSQEFGIALHTVAVAQNYFDRCVVKNNGGSVDLQLLALSCLVTASKFFDQRPISFVEARSIVENMYDQSALVATENRILELLDWKLNCVTSYETMSMFLSYDINKDELMSHANLFLIFSLSDSSFVGYTPTILGLASILCAFDNTGITPQFWTAWISQFMTLGPEVRECAKMMLDCMTRHSPPPSDEPAHSSAKDVDSRCESPVNVTDVLGAAVPNDEFSKALRTGEDQFFAISDFF